MKKLLALILALLMIALPLASCDTEDDAKESETSTETGVPASDTEAKPQKSEYTLNPDDEKLYVGYARECMTPYADDGKLQKGTLLTGYAEARTARSVWDDIYASCTALKDKSGNMALIFTLDLHSMQPSFAKTLQKALERETGVNADNIILNVTHAHSTPHTSDIASLVEEKVMAAAKAAIDDLTLVTALFTGTVAIENMNFIRRYIEENGTPVAHIAENDGNMPVVRFAREGDKKDVILANWAAHPDSLSDANTLSADYVAYFRREIEEKLDAYVSFHLGASGDVNPSGKLAGEPPFPGTVKYGKQLATHLIDAIDSLERQTIKSEIKSSFEKVKVAFDHSEDDKGEGAKEIADLYYADGKVDAEINALIVKHGFASIYEALAVYSRYTAKDFDRITVGAVSIGNVVFGVAPYEMFAINGKNVKDSADEFDLAFMCAYSNGMLGYIASEESFKYDIYEVYSRKYEKETATLLQNAIINAIDELGK